MATSASTLGYALLGLLHGTPQSGYDLRKTFVNTPMAVFSDSPGAIYPALRRLQRRRWIAAVAGARGGRRRKTWAPTELGRRAFREWLQRRPTRDDVVRRWDVLMLRLAFMEGPPAPPMPEFLSHVRAELVAHASELEAFEAEHAVKMPLGARLAYRSGVEICRARLAWVENAMGRGGGRRRMR